MITKERFPSVAVVALISNSSRDWDLIIFVNAQENGSEIVKEKVLSFCFIVSLVKQEEAAKHLKHKSKEINLEDHKRSGADLSPSGYSQKRRYIGL